MLHKQRTYITDDALVMYKVLRHCNQNPLHSTCTHRSNWLTYYHIFRLPNQNIATNLYNTELESVFNSYSRHNISIYPRLREGGMARNILRRVWLSSSLVHAS